MRGLKKRKGKITALLLAAMMILGSVVPNMTADAKEKKVSSKEEFTYAGKTGEGTDKYMGDPVDVYTVDASVQKPDNYTDIVGFKITAKYVKHGNYGGGAEDDSFQCGMILATKGKHDPSEYNFTYPNGQTPDFDLSTQTIAGIGVGEAGWLVTMAFSPGVSTNEEAKDGDEIMMEYKGTTAVFSEDDPCMTLVNFIGDFEYESIEWITGSPEEIKEEKWDPVDTIDYTDIPTVADDKQNGFNYVDISVPDTGKDSYPVVLWIHGGGYITGDRKNCLLDTTKKYLLAHGYAFASVDYTLTTTENSTDISNAESGADVSAATASAGQYLEGGMPQMLYDIKAAVRFLRAHGDEYKLNTDFIAAMGESAGAGLALLMATTNGDSDYEDLDMGNADYSSDVQAACSYCGPSDFTGDNINNMYAYLGQSMLDMSQDELEELAEKWSPTEQVNSDTPALFLAYSKADTTVPFDHAEKMEEAAKIYMDEEDIVTTYYENGGHVDRSVFDSYTEYVTVTQFLDTQKAKFIETSDDQNANDTSAQEASPKSTFPLAAVIIIVVALVAAVLVVVVVVRKRKK